MLSALSEMMSWVKRSLMSWIESYPAFDRESALPDGNRSGRVTKVSPTYTIHERVAWDHISPTSDAIDLAEKADAICFGTLANVPRQSRETIQAISSFAPKDAYRLLDINLRQRYYDKGVDRGVFVLSECAEGE